MSAGSGSGSGMSADLMTSRIEMAIRQVMDVFTDGRAMYIIFDISMTNARIDEMFRQATQAIETGCSMAPRPDQCIVRGFISGYDDDIREVWQIRECQEFYKKIIEQGWYGLARYPWKWRVKTACQVADAETKNEFYLPLEAAYGGGTVDKMEAQTILMKSILSFNKYF